MENYTLYERESNQNKNYKKQIYQTYQYTNRTVFRKPSKKRRLKRLHTSQFWNCTQLLNQNHNILQEREKLIDWRIIWTKQLWRVFLKTTLRYGVFIWIFLLLKSNTFTIVQIICSNHSNGTSIAIYRCI